MTPAPKQSKKAAKKTAARKTGAVTLDGQPAQIILPVRGIATVRQTDGPKYLALDVEKMRALHKKTGGAFSSPAFARPRTEI